MNYETLTAQQALRIAELEGKVKMYDEAAKDIHLIIYCIGGPLNDNKLRYTNNQKMPFAEIASIVEMKMGR